METNNTDTPKNKLIAELNKLKSCVTDKVWAEMSKQIKVIKQKKYVIPDDGEQAERAERIREEAEDNLNGREVFRPYENMSFAELSAAWQTIPEIKNDFDSVWQFICYIARIFPDSKAQELARKRRPADYPQEANSVEDSDNEKRIIEIDLNDFQDRKNPFSKNLLKDLVDYPKRVKYNETWHGKHQPNQLCSRLRKKTKKIYKELADYIKSRKESGQTIIYLDENIRVTCKKNTT